jgi:hypothetical protein
MYIVADNAAQAVEQFREAMESLGQSYFRGVIYALNGTAKAAQKDIISILPRIIDQPTPFTLRAIKSSFAALDSHSISLAEARVFWLDDQSAYAKYLFGDGEQIRKPGDIGPADKYIYVPIWANLSKYEGITPKYGANLPRNTLKAFGRRAGVTIAGERSGAAKTPRGKSGIFWAERNGVRGFWSRERYMPVSVSGPRLPPRAPQPLVLAVEQTRHQPVLEAPWQRVMADQWELFPGRLKKELAEKIRHIESKGIKTFVPQRTSPISHPLPPRWLNTMASSCGRRTGPLRPAALTWLSS